MRSVDIILADVHFWGGFRENQRMIAVCEAFQLGVGLHSDRELGISTAAMLHLAASTPNLVYAIDSRSMSFMIPGDRTGYPRCPFLGHLTTLADRFKRDSKHIHVLGHGKHTFQMRPEISS